VAECGAPGGPREEPARQEKISERIAEKAVAWTGTTAAFIIALGIIVVWGVTGPIFKFSDTWQLIINTGTTIVTFLMVFLLQRAQNKDSQAVHLKLNELVAATRGSSNRLIAAECLTEQEMHTLSAHYQRLVQLAKQDGTLTQSHSVEEAADRHSAKSPPTTASKNGVAKHASPRKKNPRKGRAGAKRK
jgi:low affinity Fe/Cu permease